MPNSWGYRCAFTLVELVIVLAILGLLLGLLLPAVQRVREAARRTACLNNLRQLAIASHHYQANHGHFPVGCTEWRAGGDTGKRQLAWSVWLLPMLEQDTVYQQLDLTQGFDSPANASAAATEIAVFQCPSTDMKSASALRGRSDYGGIYGERIMSPNHPPKGTMLIDRPVRFTEISDGSSNTLLIGEDAGWPDGEWINGRNIFDQAFAINRAPSFENDLRSQHPGGVNVGFADAHVKFLNETMEIELLAAICTRAGGEPVSWAD